MKNGKDICSHWAWVLRPTVVAEGRGTLVHPSLTILMPGAARDSQGTESKKAPEGQHLLECLGEYFLLQVIEEPVRRGAVVDLIRTNKVRTGEECEAQGPQQP